MHASISSTYLETSLASLPVILTELRFVKTSNSVVLLSGMTRLSIVDGMSSAES